MSIPYHNKALPEGSLLREWRLDSVLGVGGFGIVYRGRGVYFDEVVAIKEYFPGAISDRVDVTTVSPSDSSAEETYALGLQKFLEEAKVLWNLSKPERHPNIVSVKALFETHGTAYMVMDFETGVSLSQMLKSGRKFDEASLLGVIRPIAEGLDRAHRAGVLHRDIKPANIIVDDNGRPVLIDFGSARFDSGQATSTKVTFYTPPYAALEQYVKTYPQGPWTDIYALGVTLYECVAGEKPPEVLERLHGGEDKPLSGRDWPGFSPAFIRAVDAAMAIKPADRPQSVAQWLRMFEPQAAAEDLEATRIVMTPSQPAPAPAQAPTPAPPPEPAATTTPAPLTEPPATPRKRAPGLGLIAAGAAAVVVAAVGGVLMMQREPAPATANAPAASSGVASAPAAAGPAPGASLTEDMDGLIGEAQRVGLAAKDIAALQAAKAKLVASAGDAERTDAVKSAVAGVNTALARGVRIALRDVAQNTTWQAAQRKGAVGASATAAQALKDFNTASAATGAAATPEDALSAARRSLLAYETFFGAFTAAQGEILTAQRELFVEAETAAKQSSTQVIELAGKPKPGIFAGKERRAAWDRLQTEAVRARAAAAELTALGEKARTATRLPAINEAIAKATTLRTELGVMANRANLEAAGGKTKG